MIALSGGRSKRYFRISEHHPRWTSDRTFCVTPEPVWFYICAHAHRHFRSKTLAPFLLSIVKAIAPPTYPAPEGSTQHPVSCNSAHEVGRPASDALCTA